MRSHEEHQSTTLPQLPPRIRPEDSTKMPSKELDKDNFQEEIKLKDN